MKVSKASILFWTIIAFLVVIFLLAAIGKIHPSH